MNQVRFTLTIVCFLLSFSIGHSRLAQAQGVIGIDQILWIRGGHAGAVNYVAFSPDGSLAASVDGMVKIWRVADGQLLRTITPESLTSNISFFPDGQTFAVAAANGIRVYRISDGTLVRIIDPMTDSSLIVNKIAVSPDGSSIAYATGPFVGNLALVTLVTGTVQWTRSIAPFNATIGCLSFSSDGMTIFTGNASQGSGSEFHSWSASDGALLRTLTVNDPVFSCAASPDGQWWCVGIFQQGQMGPGGGVRLVSTSTEGNVQFSTFGGPTLEEPGAPRSIAFSNDSQKVAYSFTPSQALGPSPIRLRGVPDHNLIGELGAHEAGLVIALAFSPNGTLVASGGGDHTFRFWSVSDHSNPPVFIAPGHAGELSSAACSPNGMLIASCGADFTELGFYRRGAIKLWSQAGDLLRTLFTDSQVHSIAFSPEGSLFASGSDPSMDGTIKLWRASDGALLNSFPHTGSVSELAYSTNGGMIASASFDDNVVRLWSVPDGSEIRTLGPHGSLVKEIAFSSDGQLVATAADQLRLWRISDGSLVQSFPTFAASVAFTPDGQHIASAGTMSGSFASVVALWRIADGSMVRTYQPQGGSSFYGALHSSVAISPDGRTVAAADGDRALFPGLMLLLRPAAIQFWRLSDGEPLGFIDQEMANGLASISFSLDGRSLCFGRRNVGARDDGTVGLLRVPMSCLAADNVTNRVSISRGGFRYNRLTRRYVQTVIVRNTSASPIQGPVSLVLDNLSVNAFLHNATDFTTCMEPIGSPFINVNVGSDGLLSPGESRSVVLQFDNPTNQGISYATRVLAGAGER